jgi:HTH-type transcriptional regulator / antitoxin HigA
MNSSTRAHNADLPRSFAGLAAIVAARALTSESARDKAADMIDRLMAAGRLNAEQHSYLETLVQLVEAYESKINAIAPSAKANSASVLRHLLAAHGMTAADLGRVLGTHPSLGSKILTGARALTVEHIRALATRFHVGPEVFID